MTEHDIFEILQQQEIQKIIKKLYNLHQETKRYLLTAEEVSEDGVALIQPLKEHRDAYDHIIRIFASTAKKIPQDCNYYNYVKGNLEKAYGHEYRAFFDTADWLSYNLRRSLRERINRIPYQKRKDMIPDYPETIKLLNQYPFKFSELRKDKDIVDASNSDNTVDEYKIILDTLIELYKQIESI